MREANRRAFVQGVSAAPGIELSNQFKFSRHASDAASQLPSDTVKELGETFRVVGGTGMLDSGRLERFARRMGTDDCFRIDGDEFVVEYDERLHFTTFRGLTLTSSLYDRLKVGFNLTSYASVCGTVPMTGSSGRAHNDAAHRDFECPKTPGECRHRQRAFYDFLKDVFMGLDLDGMPRLIRISDLTDVVGGHSLRDILEGDTPAESRALVDLLRDKARLTL